MTDCKRVGFEVDCNSAGYETALKANTSRRIVNIPIPEHTGIYKLHLEATQRTLDCANDTRAAVKLPEGISEADWIAAKIISLYEELDIVGILIQDYCTEEVCTKMQAGKDTFYCWACEEQPTPKHMPARQYMTTLIDYANNKLRNQDIFPREGQKDQKNPKKFMETVQKLLKRFFRVYAHAYLHHFEDIRKLDCVAHVNCSFKHFLYFVREFDLVSLDDMAPLRGLVDKFLKPATKSVKSATKPDAVDS